MDRRALFDARQNLCSFLNSNQTKSILKVTRKNFVSFPNLNEHMKKIVDDLFVFLIKFNLISNLEETKELTLFQKFQILIKYLKDILESKKFHSFENAEVQRLYKKIFEINQYASEYAKNRASDLDKKTIGVLKGYMDDLKQYKKKYNFRLLLCPNAQYAEDKKVILKKWKVIYFYAIFDFLCSANNCLYKYKSWVWFSFFSYLKVLNMLHNERFSETLGSTQGMKELFNVVMAYLRRRVVLGPDRLETAEILQIYQHLLDLFDGEYDWTKEGVTYDHKTEDEKINKKLALVDGGKDDQNTEYCIRDPLDRLDQFGDSLEDVDRHDLNAELNPNDEMNKEYFKVEGEENNKPIKKVASNFSQKGDKFFFKHYSKGFLAMQKRYKKKAVKQEKIKKFKLKCKSVAPDISEIENEIKYEIKSEKKEEKRRKKEEKKKKSKSYKPTKHKK